jgi:hypothetical protein
LARSWACAACWNRRPRRRCLHHADLLRQIRAADEATNAALRDGDVNAYMESNFRFHSLIYRAAPAPVTNRMIESLWMQFGPFMRVVYGRYGTAAMEDHHQEATKAIARGDAGAVHRDPGRYWRLFHADGRMAALRGLIRQVQPSRSFTARQAWSIAESVRLRGCVRIGDGDRPQPLPPDHIGRQRAIQFAGPTARYIRAHSRAASG